MIMYKSVYSFCMDFDPGSRNLQSDWQNSLSFLRFRKSEKLDGKTIILGFTSRPFQQGHKT